MSPKMKTDDDLWADQRREVRALLRDLGWSQSELALRLDITQKHLSQVLTGRVDGSLPLWSKIADIMGLKWQLMPKQHRAGWRS